MLEIMDREQWLEVRLPSADASTDQCTATDRSEHGLRRTAFQGTPALVGGPARTSLRGEPPG